MCFKSVYQIHSEYSNYQYNRLLTVYRNAQETFEVIPINQFLGVFVCTHTPEQIRDLTRRFTEYAHVVDRNSIIPTISVLEDNIKFKNQNVKFIRTTSLTLLCSFCDCLRDYLPIQKELLLQFQDSICKAHNRTPKTYCLNGELRGSRPKLDGKQRGNPLSGRRLEIIAERAKLNEEVLQDPKKIRTMMRDNKLLVNLSDITRYVLPHNIRYPQLYNRIKYYLDLCIRSFKVQRFYYCYWEELHDIMTHLCSRAICTRRLVAAVTSNSFEEFVNTKVVDEIVTGEEKRSLYANGVFKDYSGNRYRYNKTQNSMGEVR